MTIRISPQRQSNRNSLLAQLPQRGLRTTFEEREMERCVPMSGISGVQTGTGNRLLLFLRDDRIVSINLERACRARDFYSGFYIERSEDGQLCVGRDELQSRSGAKCEVERMRQLVAVENWSFLLRTLAHFLTFDPFLAKRSGTGRGFRLHSANPGSHRFPLSGHFNAHDICRSRPFTRITRSS